MKTKWHVLESSGRYLVVRECLDGSPGEVDSQWSSYDEAAHWASFLNEGIDWADSQKLDPLRN